MKNIIVISALLTVFISNPYYCAADDASVLPKGNFAFNINYKHYLPWDERYDRNGDTEDAAIDFNTPLDNNVFPVLNIFDGLVPGAPNIGSTVTSFEYSYERLEAIFAYGLTDNLSFGIKIPYIWYKNKVKADLDTSNANLGKNNLYKQSLLPEPYNSSPILPLNAPGLPPGAITPMTAEDVQALIGPGLSINGEPAIPGYGFDRFETWEDDGLGNIEAGLKYRYFKNDNWQLAGLAGVIFPTGEGPDPDSLQAEQLGSDYYGIELRSYNDYTGIKNVLINASVFYTFNLPYTDTFRIVDDPHSPLSSTKASLDIDPGDLLELETSIAYQFDKSSALYGTSVSLLYNYTKGYKDSVSGPGSDSLYKGMEIETDGEEQIFIIGLGYSTVPLFLANEFPVPIDFSFAYRNKFAGTNSTFKTEYLEAGLTVYF